MIKSLTIVLMLVMVTTSLAVNSSEEEYTSYEIDPQIFSWLIHSSGNTLNQVNPS